MKIFVLGVSGLVGSAYARTAARRGHEVIGAVHHAPAPENVAAEYPLDATDDDALTRACLDLRPEVIVNAAAISSAASVDAEPKPAARINVALPRRLARLSSRIGARFIHLSSDLVFDGRGNEPVPSTARPAPTSLYGLQKVQAERDVLRHSSRDPVVLRIALVSGNSPDGRRSVHEKLLHAIARGERPRMFVDEIRQPTPTGNLANVLLELSERRDLCGIFHWAGREAISRHQIAVRILRHLGLPASLVEPTRKADDPAFADRPSHLGLDLRPLEGTLRTSPASFQELLDEIQIPASLQDWYGKTRNAG